jgi:hypothetical protein
MSLSKEMTRLGHNGLQRLGWSLLGSFKFTGRERHFACTSVSLCWLLVVVRHRETLQVLVEAALALVTVAELKDAKEWLNNGPNFLTLPLLVVHEIARVDWAALQVVVGHHWTSRQC